MFRMYRVDKIRLGFFFQVDTNAERDDLCTTAARHNTRNIRGCQYPRKLLITLSRYRDNYRAGNAARLHSSDESVGWKSDGKRWNLKEKLELHMSGCCTRSKREREIARNSKVPSTVLPKFLSSRIRTINLVYSREEETPETIICIVNLEWRHESLGFFSLFYKVRLYRNDAFRHASVYGEKEMTELND